jgi:SAM-dependent methyltransferase
VGSGKQRAPGARRPAISPPRLCFLVSANYSPFYFVKTGAQGARSIAQILERNGIGLARLGNILDFGCGCGRTTRHWVCLDGPAIFGTDINPQLIRWARKHLDFGTFDTNGLFSRLRYPDSQFDLVYAISVFTHLSEPLQRWWMGELARVVRPGGHLLLSVKGRDLWNELTPSEAEAFSRGELVVKEGETSGSNYCAAFHPDMYIRKTLAAGFEVLEHEPMGSRDTQQDFYLMRKSEG